MNVEHRTTHKGLKHRQVASHDKQLLVPQSILVDNSKGLVIVRNCKQHACRTQTLLSSSIIHPLRSALVQHRLIDSLTGRFLLKVPIIPRAKDKHIKQEIVCNAFCDRSLRVSEGTSGTGEEQGKPHTHCCQVQIIAEGTIWSNQRQNAHLTPTVRSA